MQKSYPSLQQIKSAIGPVKKSTFRSLGFASLDVLSVLACVGIGLSGLFPIMAHLLTVRTILDYLFNF